MEKQILGVLEVEGDIYAAIGSEEFIQKWAEEMLALGYDVDPGLLGTCSDYCLNKFKLSEVPNKQLSEIGEWSMTDMLFVSPPCQHHANTSKTVLYRWIVLQSEGRSQKCPCCGDYTDRLYTISNQENFNLEQVREEALCMLCCGREVVDAPELIVNVPTLPSCDYGHEAPRG